MSKRRVVYSTDQGRYCPDCSRPKNQCVCRSPGTKSGNEPPGNEPSENEPRQQHIVRLQRQVKGRAGKPVVIISGLALSGGDLKRLAKKLKSKCGVGGSIEDRNILIQGNNREMIKSELESLGYTVKLSGG